MNTAVVTVHGTALLFNSTISEVYKDKRSIKPLCSIIDSQENIQRNVCQINFSELSTTNLEANKYKHEIQVVRISQLLSKKAFKKQYLEPTYGTTVSFVKIHQK